MSVKDVDFYRILSVWKVFGDTGVKGRDYRKVCALFFFYPIYEP